MINDFFITENDSYDCKSTTKQREFTHLRIIYIYLSPWLRFVVYFGLQKFCDFVMFHSLQSIVFFSILHVPFVAFFVGSGWEIHSDFVVKNAKLKIMRAKKRDEKKNGKKPQQKLIRLITEWQPICIYESRSTILIAMMQPAIASIFSFRFGKENAYILSLQLDPV